MEAARDTKNFPREAIAVKSYQRAYEIPLIAHAGSRLTILRRDPDWPGWVWCKGQAGIEAWAPESWLTILDDQAILKKDYNSAELSFEAGKQLTILFEECGWYLASTTDEEVGWVPAEHVQIKSDS